MDEFEFWKVKDPAQWGGARYKLLEEQFEAQLEGITKQVVKPAYTCEPEDDVECRKCGQGYFTQDLLLMKASLKSHHGKQIAVKDLTDQDVEDFCAYAYKHSGPENSD